MTIYAGEYIHIAVSIKGQRTPGRFEVLTDEDLDSAVISIWNEEGRKVVNDDTLAYDPDSKLWKFHWDSQGNLPGRYEYRATFTGEGERRTWEEGSVTLHRSIRPVTLVVE